MPEPHLTRRRYPERHDCGHIYFGDVHVGTIAKCVGNPGAAEQWQWLCGFYPGSDPGEETSGTAADFEQARADFEEAWRVFSARRTEADYQAWRNQRDWTARKYAMQERGGLMPSQKPNSMMRCPCGTAFDSHKLEHTLIHVPHITAANGTIQRQ